MTSIRRRKFITLLGGAAAAWPLAAGAQQAAVPVVGFLHGTSFDGNQHSVAAFHRGLNEAGFVEGQNVAIVYRWAERQYDRLPELAADLVGRRVAVIAAFANAPNAAKAATSIIPIVFNVGGDPVELGLVAAINRPGGNATGVSMMTAESTGKRLELLHQLVPNAKTIAYFRNPTGTRGYDTEVAGAAPALGLQVQVFDATSDRDIEQAYAALAQRPADALFMSGDPLFNLEQQGALAAAARLPASGVLREFPAGGGLMSYGPSLADAYRIVGGYCGRILKGEKPTDLPVIRPTKFELVINLTTAKALGLTVPDKLIALADEVIE